MIQRIQSLYLLISALILFVVFYLPLGYVDSEVPAKFTICGFFDGDSGDLIRANGELATLLLITVAVQLISIFFFKNRKIQALIVQVCLILILLIAVSALLFGDIFSLADIVGDAGVRINYNWNVTLLGISWILTFLALRGIRKDEALVRSANRMR